MKKLLSRIATVVMLIGGLSLVSCNGKKAEVKNFALDFGRKVAENKIDSIKAQYPAVEMADSLSLTLIPDSVTVETTDKDNEFKVNYGAGKYIVVGANEDGSFAVLQSEGLFVFAPEDVKFATEIGGIKGETTDAQCAEVVSNLPGVKTWLLETKVDELKNAIKVSKSVITKDFQSMIDPGRGYYNVTNTTDRDIKGSEYEMVWRCSYIGPYMGTGMVRESTSYRVTPGKDIPAHGTIKADFTFTYNDTKTLQAARMKTPDLDTFLAQYKPTGKEYEEYMKTHTPAPGGKLADGPYNISGKIGGKFAVHMTLDKGMKTGSYYYDKNGAGNKLSLQVKSFDPKTGKILLEERNANGQVTGTFNGTLTPTNFTGQMTVTLNNKTYNFDMPVTQ